jgi:hypothetical protein
MQGMEDTAAPVVRVVYEPGREAVTLDEVDTPTLKFGKHPEHGYGWILHYLEDSSVKTHFLPGDLNVDQVVKDAQAWLRQSMHSSSA